MNKIAPQFKSLFWDTDFDRIDLQKNAPYVIERLLDKGNLEAARWVRNTFPESLIKDTLIKRRGFSLKNITFWATIYNISFDQIQCFQEPYLTTRRKLWPY